MVLAILCFDIQSLVNCKKVCKILFANFKSIFLKTVFFTVFFQYFRKVFVASTCDFLLIFGECATLMGRNVLSKEIFKVCTFWSCNYASNRIFQHILGPPHIFSIFSTQNNPCIDFFLHAKFENVWIVRSWDIFSERISVLWFSG